MGTTVPPKSRNFTRGALAVIEQEIHNMHTKQIFREAFFAFVNILFSVTASAQNSSNYFTTPVQIENTIIERTKAGVAQVFATTSVGSGFFIDIKGVTFLITNTHVIESAIERTSPGQTRNISQIRIRTAFGEETRASVWKESRNHDIAVLKLERVPTTVVPLEINPMIPIPGTEVFLWGAPRGINLVPLDGAVYQIEANNDTTLFAGTKVKTILARISVAPGNSGGPLLDRQGRVLGVISARQHIENIHTGISVAIAAAEFAVVIASFNPKDAENLAFLGPIPSPQQPRAPGPRSTPPESIIPSPSPIEPKGSLSDFARGEMESASYPCIQRLRVPPGDIRHTYYLSETGPVKLLQFPLNLNRLKSSRMLGPQNLEILVTPSRDGGDTFICVLR